MSAEVKALTVLLEPGVSEETCLKIAAVIAAVRWVDKVETHVSNLDHWTAVESAKLDLRRKLWDALK